MDESGNPDLWVLRLAAGFYHSPDICAGHEHLAGVESGRKTHYIRV